jgi:hypothetical protein
MRKEKETPLILMNSNEWSFIGKKISNGATRSQFEQISTKNSYPHSRASGEQCPLPSDIVQDSKSVQWLVY